MADLNNICIGGRLMGQPRISNTGGSNGSRGVKLARFTLACHRAVRDESQPTGWAEMTDRIAVICFGWVADRAERLGVGAYITLSGRVQTYEYERTATTTSGEEATVQVTGFEVVADELNRVIAGRERERETSEVETEGVGSNSLSETLA